MNKSTQQIAYPKCPKGNEARSVCLNQKCQLYPFYCAVCAEQTCEIIHQHADRITSTGFRQFMKNINEASKPKPELEEVCLKYKKCLERLRQQTIKFVQKEFEEVDNLLKKSTELPSTEKSIVKRIIDKEYSNLKGWEMDKVWVTVNQINQPENKKFAEEIGYIKVKTEEVNDLSQQFSSMSNLIEHPQKPQQNKNPITNLSSAPSTKSISNQKQIKK